MQINTLGDLFAVMSEGVDEEKSVIHLDKVRMYDIRQLLSNLSLMYDDEGVFLTYPNNLYRAVFGSCDADHCLYTAEQKNGLECALSRLSDKERRVLSALYEEELNLQDASAELGETVATIRSIEAKALRRLKKIPWVIPPVKTGREETGEQPEEKQNDPDCKFDTLPIEIFGFSRRTYGCLARAYIASFRDLRTQSMHDILRIRCLGQKGRDEIVERVQEKIGVNLQDAWEENEAMFA